VTAITHIAGHAVRVGTRQRQRCSWCGATLIDDDLATIAVPIGQDPTIPTWPAGELVEVFDGRSVLIGHEDGAELPANACGQLDPDVTIGLYSTCRNPEQRGTP
jgi:hypothetical protein